MRLHRLAVKNFRGIEDREIVFADSGITVVEGANEAGKSSMIEALDLLLTMKADSGSAKVKQVKPMSADVGSEVVAEITCGPWRFEYFKRFNRRAATTLRMLAPRREELTGRAAHERVEQILAQEMDVALFDALRLVQTAEPELGSVAGSTALSQALDRAVANLDAAEPDSAPNTGPAGDGDRSGTALIDAVDAEYQRYFTLKTGRPARELAAALTTAASAHADIAASTAALRAADEAAELLPRVVAEQRLATEAEVQAGMALSDASRRLAEAEKLAARLEQAREAAERRRIGAKLADHRLGERVADEQRLAELTERIARDGEVIRAHADAATKADADADALEAALSASRAEAATVGDEVRAAEAAEAHAASRQRIAAIDRALGAAAEVGVRRAQLVAAIDANPVVPEHAATATELDRQLAVLQAKVEAIAATIEVTPRGGAAVTVDGVPLGAPAEFSALGESVVEAPGVRVVVRGAANARECARQLDAMRVREADLVALCGVESLTQVSGRAEARSADVASLRELDAELRRVLAGATEASLRAERADLELSLPADQTPAPARGAAALRAAERELIDVIGRGERAVAARRATAQASRAAGDAQAAASTRDREAASQQRVDLLAARAQFSEDALRGAALTARQEHSDAVRVVEERAAAVAAADLAGLRAQVAEAEQEQDRWRHRGTTLRDRKTQLETMIEVCRSENRLGELGRARTAAAAADAELARVQSRADGARVLHETLGRTQTLSRSRYLAPFTRRLEELAAPVFGESVRFEVDENFSIVRRTLDGVTVDVAALSGGAREQLGLIARLACAMIVDPADGVPVILDDALGYSDPDRLASMAQVLDRAANNAQIIVLTCTPDRYAAVPDARVVAV